MKKIEECLETMRLRQRWLKVGIIFEKDLGVAKKIKSPLLGLKYLYDCRDDLVKNIPETEWDDDFKETICKYEEGINIFIQKLLKEEARQISKIFPFYFETDLLRESKIEDLEEKITFWENRLRVFYNLPEFTRYYKSFYEEEIEKRIKVLQELLEEEKKYRIKKWKKKQQD